MRFFSFIIFIVVTNFTYSQQVYEIDSTHVYHNNNGDRMVYFKVVSFKHNYLGASPFDTLIVSCSEDEVKFTQYVWVCGYNNPLGKVYNDTLVNIDSLCISNDQDIVFQVFFNANPYPDPFYDSLIDHTNCGGSPLGNLYISDTLTYAEQTLNTSKVEEQFEHKIYPNPLEEFLTINFPPGNTRREVYIYNDQGELLVMRSSSDDILKIHTQSLSAGIYILNVKDESSSKIYKLVKL